jgi:hypothetical protein
MGEALFSGWAPDAPVEDSLLRRFVFAQAGRAAFLSERLDRPHVRRDAFAAVDTGGSIVFDNFAVLLQPPAMFDLAAAVREIDAFFPAGRPFVIMSAWHLGDLAEMSGGRLQLMGHPPFMFRPAGDGAVRDTDLRIVEVTSSDEVETFVNTICDAYPMPRSEPTAFDPRILGGPMKLYLGYDGDRPVATAGAVVEAGINDVEWISVMDDCRSRGFGEAVTWQATRADPELPAALIASDLGFGVYRRLGYEPMLRFTLWFRPPAG